VWLYLVTVRRVPVFSPKLEGVPPEKHIFLKRNFLQVLPVFIHVPQACHGVRTGQFNSQPAASQGFRDDKGGP